LWTASSDKTAKCLSRDRNWAVDTELSHPDFVRDVVVDEEDGLIVTACRDEGVRVWEKGSGKLVHNFDGHFDEVTALVLLHGTAGKKVVSVSIDGTIRTWGLSPAAIKKAKEDAGKELSHQKEKPDITLTEEEERELAELEDMSD
jgi:WD40 repeat protein